MTEVPNKATETTPVESPFWLRLILFVVSALCIGAGVFRMVKLDAPDQEVLLFFLAAAVVLLADSIKKLKFGDLEVERVSRLEERVQELAEVSRAPEAAFASEPLAAAAGVAPSVPHVLKRPLEIRALELAQKIYHPPLRYEDDPVTRHPELSTSQRRTFATT